MYVIGACFPVLSPYLVSLARSARSGSRNKSSTLPSWRLDIERDPADAAAHPVTIGRAERHPKRYQSDEELDTVLETVGVGISCDRAVIVTPTQSRGGTGTCVFSRTREHGVGADETMDALTPATVVASLDSAVGMHMMKEDVDLDSRVRINIDRDLEMQFQIPAEVHESHAHLRTRSDDGVRYSIGRRRSDGDLAAWKGRRN
ncbi:hypothetical protein ABW21_db0208883 [Orbilia brochopaga]|nr:hypothetical protein ABW21_db0208883 [Drechslerella brochopaga]